MPTRRIAVHFPAWVLAIASAASLGGAMAQDRTAVVSPPTVEISIDNFTFTPAEITITPGTVVRWVNHDDIPHTVVDSGKTFRSKPLDTGDSFSSTFSTSGSFAYFCSLHPHMTGTVIVKAGS